MTSFPLGDRLKAWRAERGVKQKDLADTIGIDPGYLSKLERGTHVPSVAVLTRIAATIGASVSELTDEDLQVAEPTSSYGVTMSRPAPAGLKVAGFTCATGDTLTFAATSVAEDRDVILGRRRGMEVIGVVASHPSTGDEMLWLPDGSSELLEETEVLGVAVSVSRPVKRV